MRWLIGGSSVRRFGGLAVLIVIVFGVAVSALGFLYLDFHASDPAADDSLSVQIVYDTASGEPRAAPPRRVTDYEELRVWLVLLSINLGLAAALGVGLILGAVAWWDDASKRPPLPGWWAAFRSAVLATLLVGAAVIVSLGVDAIGVIETERAIEPEALVPRVFDAADWVTRAAVVIGWVGIGALLWVREIADCDWAEEGVDRRREWVEALRHVATLVLGGLSLIIVAAVFSTGALVNLVQVAFGDAITVVDGVAVMFGALLSAVLALAYLPTHAAFERQAQRIVDVVAPVSLDPFDETALKKRNVVSAIVEAGRSGRSSVEEKLLIAGPLLSSLVTVILR